MPLELPTKLDNKEQVITVDLKGTLNDYTFDQFFKKMTELSNNKDFKTIKLNFCPFEIYQFQRNVIIGTFE